MGHSHSNDGLCQSREMLSRGGSLRSFEGGRESSEAHSGAVSDASPAVLETFRARPAAHTAARATTTPAVPSPRRVSKFRPAAACFERSFLTGRGDGHLPAGAASPRSSRPRTFHSAYAAASCARELGKGAFGWVQQCRHRPTGQLRAVKRIPKQNSASVATMRREVEVLRVMDHPNIARLYEFFEDARYIILCMELCEGGELEERIGSAGRLLEREAAGIAGQLLRAVNYMQTVHSLAHRDLKPSNCVLAGARDLPLEDCTLKVIDFGLATWCPPGTCLDEAVGTAAYAAPEVIVCAYDLRCDLWSAGIMIYELVSGRLPRCADVDFVLPAWQSVSQAAKELLTGLLQRDPGRRWSAQRCLQHKWIQEATARPSSDRVLHADVVLRMKEYAQSSLLRKAALQTIATRLHEEQIQELEQAFVRLDTTGTGILSLQDLRAGLAGSGVSSATAQLFEGIDTDCDGELQYTEFLAAALDARRYLRHDIAWAAFHKLDRDGDGRITRDDLRAIFGDTAAGREGAEEARALAVLAERQISSVIALADVDGDGAIDFEEFIAMLEGDGTEGFLTDSRRKPAAASPTTRKRPSAATVHSQSQARLTLRRRPGAADI